MTSVRNGSPCGAVFSAAGARIDAMLDAAATFAYLTPYLLVLVAMLSQPAAVIPAADD